jgi:tetratricopeptide (TPR) repeat protein
MPITSRKLAIAAALLLAGVAATPLRAQSAEAGVNHWRDGNYAAAVNIWRPLATKGDPDAQFNLGQAYKLGRGVPANMTLAKAWFQKAAQQGVMPAQANLGLILYFNDGNHAAALPWIRKAAEQGEPRCQYVLGTELFNGQRIARDWPRAYALVTRAAAQGLPQAAGQLQEMERMIPAAQRQRGIALARQMERGQSLATVVPPPARSVVVRTSPPAPPPLTPRGTSSGRWRVQLGAFGNATNARRQWDSLRARVSGLAGLQPVFTPAGAMTRLQAGPLASRAAADRICASAKAAGASCFPVAP